STAHESPIQSWNMIRPSVVSASKSGAVSPILSVISFSFSSPSWFVPWYVALSTTQRDGNVSGMHPGDAREALAESLSLLAEEAVRYLDSLDTSPVRPPSSGTGSKRVPLPEEGDGSLATLRALIDAAEAESTRSAGPRFFHFVMGGGTPAALGADWLASAI